MFLLGERGRFAPFGVAGGSRAALNRFFWQTDEGERSPPMASKVANVKIRAGQRTAGTPGGGGWGDPMAEILSVSPATFDWATSMPRRRPAITAS